MSDQKIQLNNRKRVALVVSAVLAAALVLGGTFAWQSLNTRGVYDATGEPGPAGGRLHHDGEVMGSDNGSIDWVTNVTGNNDIYVENYESAEGGRSVFVRLKMYEYMESGPGATIGPDEPGYETRVAEPLIDGTVRDDLSTWTPRLPIADIASDQFRNRWSWTMGGQKTYMPTFNKDNHSEETDVKGAAIDPNTLPVDEPANTTKIDGAYAYHADAGKHDYFDTTATWEATEKTWDSDNNLHALGTDPQTHTAKTTENANVISMEQWKQAPYNGKPGNFWVSDSDGWYYWGNPIAPQTATGLLLDSITLQGEPDDGWYYGLYVRSQMATAGDWTAEGIGGGFYAEPGEEPSPDAENLMYVITGRLPKVLAIYLDKTTAAVNVDGTLSLKVVDVLTENTNDSAWKAVTWSINPSVGTRFSSNGVFSPSGQDASKWFTIRATSVKDPAVYAECKVYVPATTQGVLEGADGNVYMYHVDNNDNTYQQVLPDGTLGLLICPVEVGKPGLPSDRPVTVIGGGHYLDTGDGKNYYAAGADGLLGTADDVLMYDSGGGVMVPSQDKIEIVVGPASLSVAKGATLAMTAVATFNGDDVTGGVGWTLVGNYATGTSISGTGANATLTVGASEGATITVRVYHEGSNGEDGGATGATNGTTKDVTVRVNSSPAANVAVGGEFTDNNGVVWKVLAKENGHSLIITKYIYGRGTSYKNSPWIYLDTAGNNLKSALQTFYTSTVGGDIKKVTVPYQSPLPDVRLTQGGYSSTENGSAGYSHPATSGTATANGSNAIFVLSISEANQYFANNSSRIAAGVSDGTTKGPWLLRSPGSTGDSWPYVRDMGAINQVVYTTVFGYRPCLWVQG
jgi:hypothetical protein